MQYRVVYGELDKSFNRKESCSVHATEIALFMAELFSQDEEFEFYTRNSLFCEWEWQGRYFTLQFINKYV